MKENKINIFDLIVKMVLIIIIIVLLLHNCSLMKKTSDDKKTTKNPTGNVDVFEIQCDREACNVNPDIDVPVINEPDNYNTIPVNGGSDSIVDDNNELVVSDNNITWTSTNNLRIFSNPIYDMEQKIAPESTNTYQFVISNNTKYNVKYSINFLETNNFNINMKYRLKRENEYVAGNDNTWVDYAELNLNDISLASLSNHTYYLDWKWESSDNDTLIGNSIDASYKLDIKIKAEQNV